MRLRICIITTVHPVFDSRIFHKEAKTLSKAGFDVQLIAQHANQESIAGIRILPLKSPDNRLDRIFRTSFQAFRLAVKQKSDVYHFHDPEFIPWAILLSIFTRAKVIYDIHEDYQQQIKQKAWLPAIVRSLFSAIFHYFELFASNFFDGLICATNDIAAKYSHQNTEVIFNYFSPEMFPQAAEQQKQSQYLRLIYIGAISEARGISDILRSVVHVDKPELVRFIFIGNFQPAAYRDDLKSLPGYQLAEFHPWMDPQKVYHALFEADVGLVCLHPLPRYQTSLPVKLFEYMAAGLPVIASDFPFWHDIILGNQCGIMVEPSNPKSIAHAIDFYLNNADERMEMGENGRIAAYQKYTWEQEAIKLLAVYERILQR